MKMSLYTDKIQFRAVVPSTIFTTIRKDEVEILSHLTELENYQLDEFGDLVIVNNLPVIDSINPPTTLNLPMTNSFSSMVNGCNGTVSRNVINAYNDVFSIDNRFAFFPEARDTSTLRCLYENDIYQGCVWTFENKDYFGIYGIRTSIANTLNNKRGVATQILTEILRITSKTIVVPWPLQGMISLLRKFNFIEYNTNKKNSIRQFLKPYTGTSNYWILDRSIVKSDKDFSI